MKFLLAIVFTAGISFFSSAQELVLPGANPDPSVVKIGDTYWASATSSNWFPAFPLLYSKDLIHWKQQGFIFNKRPAWADYYFWAPEISYDSGRVYVYYTAHKRNGGLCVGVASADRPEGPYRDHGPLICQDLGSIDAFPVRDTSGKLFLVWKEDANSVNEPTPIWAAEMNEERTALIGEKKELFRNDEPWEKALVEGVSMIRRGDYYYAFYAAAGCCGSGCNYVSGVARARDVLGPWEKYNMNPVLKDTGNWICKGHGTPIEKDGKFYFLYHGYDKTTSAFTGREGLLQEFVFTPDNWIEFINIRTDSIGRNETHKDDFSEDVLRETWQWSVLHDINYQLKDGALHLSALPTSAGSYVAQRIISAEYTANAIINAKQSTATAGLAAIGDDRRLLGILYQAGKLQILKIDGGIDSLLTSVDVTPTGKLHLQMRVGAGYNVSFLYSLDGKVFTPVNRTPIRGTFIPPWDNPPRVGLMSKGDPAENAVFDYFEIRAGVISTEDTGGMMSPAFATILITIVVAGIIWLATYLRRSRKGEKNKSRPAVSPR